MIYPRFLTGFSILVFFPNFKSHGISGQIFSLTYFFQSKGRLQVALDAKSLQEYPSNASSSMLHSWSSLFLLYINDLDVICDIAIYDDDTTLF